MTTCGTGTGNFPQPGDPDLNNSILSAAPAFGGIDVSWTYPELNSHAVAHTVLYRSTSSDPLTKVKHRVVTGDYFYDKTTTSTLVTYYYWIQIVSVNGTVGDLIGPVSAQAKPTVEQTLEMLTGQIDNGVLATEIKNELSRLDTLRQDLLTETNLRVGGDDDMGVALNTVQSDMTTVTQMIQDEINARQSGDATLVSEVNGLYVEIDNTNTLLATEYETAVEAAQARQTLQETIEANVGDQIAAVQTKAETTVIGDFIVYNGNFGQGDFQEWAVSRDVDGIENDPLLSVVRKDSTLTGAQATSEHEYMAKVEPTSGASHILAGEWQSITGSEVYVVGAWFGFDTAMLTGSLNLTVEWQDDTGATLGTTVDLGTQDLTALVPGWHKIGPVNVGSLPDAVKGRVVFTFTDTEYPVFVTGVQGERVDTAVQSLWTAKVQANNLIGGFGLYNDSGTVEAGFDVDRFWVGRTAGDGSLDSDQVKPFIIENGTTYLNEAVIKELLFNKLRSADGSLMFTPAVYDELGNLTQDGMLKAAYIDVDNLSVASAATFYGDAQSGNFQTGMRGWKLWQDGRFEIGSGASMTRDVQVDGQSIGAIKDATSRVDSWTRPETTLIDGNKISTADAYVDTLQIKGNAVTVPATDTGVRRYSIAGFQEAARVTIVLEQAGDVGIWWAFQQFYNGGGSWGYRIRRNGLTLIERAGMGAINDFPSSFFLDSNVPVGVHTYYLYWAGGGAIEATGSIYVLGVKR